MKYWDIAGILTRHFRAKRYRNFKQLFPPSKFQRVLDMGGSPTLWKMMNYDAEITLVNLDSVMLGDDRRFTSVIGDCRNLAYADQSFDLAFSNSVIEHVGGPEDAKRFAEEMQRVGKSFYCQTPNKWFPVEPHFGTLFLHWIPGLLSNYWVFRLCTLYGWVNRPDRATVKILVKDVRLLSKRELKRLFPDAEIKTERICGFPKSFFLYRHRAEVLRRTMEAGAPPVALIATAN